jgi:hypothetical protein
MVEVRQLETAIWSIADGRASDDELALFASDELRTLAVLDRLIGDAEEDLASVRGIKGEERDQVVADFTETLKSLHRTAARLRPLAPSPILMEDDDLAWEYLEPGPVELQASWSEDLVVVWAAGRGTEGETNDQLATRLEAVGGPPNGWQLHPGVPLPDGSKAEAVAIPMRGALGWLVSVGGGTAPEGVGPSLLWLGRAAVEGVRLVARGAVVPSLKVTPRRDGHGTDAAVRWVPAFVSRTVVEELAAVMPGTVTVVGNAAAHATTAAVLGAVVEAVMAEAAERVELKAQPPSAKTITDLGDSMLARLDGVPFPADVTLSRDMARRFEQWARPVTDAAHPRLVVQLDPPSSGGVWLMSVHLKQAKGKLVPIDEALRAQEGSRTAMAEWTRLGRIFPALGRAGVRARGQLALSQDEAWDFLTLVGPTLTATGFDVRAPQISRRKATPSLRLFADNPAGSVVGMHQLTSVAWSVLFDDVELTGAEVARLAKQARPLLQSHGKWIELDRVDLEQAAAALAEREDQQQMTGAEILRHSMGLDSSGLAGGISVHGQSWANDVLRRAAEASANPVSQPEGFVGELRSYQIEALSWIGFLDAAELGGCLALDMGLGKTPTVLAHLARHRRPGPHAGRRPGRSGGQLGGGGRSKFAPGCGRRAPRHPAPSAESSASAAGHRRRRHHHLRHRGARRRRLAKIDVGTASCSTRRRPSRTRPTTRPSSCAASTPAPASPSPAPPSRTASATCGPSSTSPTPVWSGRVPRSSPSCRATGEAALRALNGILVFRRTKSEPDVAAELPDRIDELDHCLMTPEQIGLYQAVLDSLVVDATKEGGEPKQGAILAAITALKQICNHPSPTRRTTTARWPAAPASWPGSRRSSSRCSPRGEDPDLHPLRRVGREAGRPPHRHHRRNRSPATTVVSARGRDKHGRGLPGRGRGRRAGAVAQGRRHRPQPHRRQPRGALRPLVEPSGGGPGPRPGLAHRPDQDRHLTPSGVPRHRRREGRGGGGRQAPHRRPRAAQVLSLADLDADQLRMAFGLRPTARWVSRR